MRFLCDEPLHFEEREFAALAAGLRGRSEALRNLARNRRRRGRPLPPMPGVEAAAAHLAEVLDAGDPDVESGAIDALGELQRLLLQLRDERTSAVAATLELLRRGATAAGSRPDPAAASCGHTS